MSAPAHLDPGPLSDDVSLQQHLELLLEKAMHRQLWFFFLDDEDRMVGPIMPCDDYPATPDDVGYDEDGNTVAAVDQIAERFVWMMGVSDLAQLVVVWERRGGDRVRPAEREWARRLGESFVAAGARVRAQFVLHDRGLRPLAADDLY